jgi:hypothetical protein
MFLITPFHLASPSRNYFRMTYERIRKGDSDE